MNRDRWARIDGLCQAALARDSADRAAFLSKECGGDEELLREVESLLFQQSHANGFLDVPAAALDEDLLAGAPLALTPGTRLGPYEVLSRIGAGGMGEVYKARDTRLGRVVAIKVLSPELSADPERRARFEREAKTIAGLNHAHICALYDVGEHDGSTFLVMEHLEGDTLATRLEKGPLPLEQALFVATEIADALATAHRHGVIHRDLKPANVMLTTAGGLRHGSPQAKLLDFGLAKLTGHGEQAAAGSLASVPTQTLPLTGEGTIVGTLQYMAPEQVEGKPADARTDLWALGAIVYEMLTGKRAFEGTSAASLITAIMSSEPPALATLQPLTPPALDRLVRRCLAKAPDERPDTAHDLADELRLLREPGGIGAMAGVQRRRGRGVRTAFGVAAGLALIAVGAASMWFLRPAAPSPLPVHSTVEVYPAETLNGGGYRSMMIPTPGGSQTALTWTPDGQALVYVGRRGAVQQLYVRRLDAEEARAVPGTEGAQEPAVSPDGGWVAFWSGGMIRKVPLRGGPVTDLTPSPNGPPKGLVWGASGAVYFGSTADKEISMGGDIKEISVQGTLKAVTTPTESEDHVLPWPLPGGRAILYTVRKRLWSWGDEEIVAQSLTDGTRQVVLRNAADARYLATGHLVFLRQGRLFAVPFDPDRLLLTGQEVAMMDQVAQALTSGNTNNVTGAGQFAVAPTGAIAWLRGDVTPYPDRTLASVDRHGQVSPLAAPVRSYFGALRRSPDGKRLAVAVRSLSGVSLWIWDSDTGQLAPRVLDGECLWPIWSPDGQRIAFEWWKDGSASTASISADAPTSSPVLLTKGMPASFTPDGQLVALRGSDIVVVNVQADQARVESQSKTPETERNPQVSPNGRWLAYGSDISGRFEIWVMPYPTGAPTQVGEGESAAWNPDGRELFFLSPVDSSGRQRMMAAGFAPGSPRPTLGRPHPLFEFDSKAMMMVCAPLRCYDVAPDGQHFYVVQSPASFFLTPVVTHINLITNWFEELKAKVPVKR